MHILAMKDMTNNTMYIVQELYAFASSEITFIGIASKVSL